MLIVPIWMFPRRLLDRRVYGDGDRHWGAIPAQHGAIAVPVEMKALGEGNGCNAAGPLPHPLGEHDCRLGVGAFQDIVGYGDAIIPPRDACREVKLLGHSDPLRMMGPDRGPGRTRAV